MTATLKVNGVRNNAGDNLNGEMQIKVDPGEKARLAILRVSEALRVLELKYNTTPESFHIFLQSRLQNLDMKIDELNRKIDSDIYRRYLDKTLKKNELKAWLADLDAWERSYLSAIKNYENNKRSGYFNSSISTTAN